jgi:hypothetical protein
MKHAKLFFIALIFSLFIISSGASAQAEVFSAAITGTRVCGPFDSQKIKQTVFVEIDLNIPMKLLISLDQDFINDVLTLDLGGYQISNTAAAFIASGGGTLGGVDTSEVIYGTAKFSTSTGALVSFSGTFIETDDAGCFSSGTLKSGKRIS